MKKKYNTPVESECRPTILTPETYGKMPDCGGRRKPRPTLDQLDGEWNVTYPEDTE